MSRLLLCVALLCAVTAVVAAANDQVKVTRFRFPKRSVSDPTPEPTDPPNPDQPTNFLIYFSDYCSAPFKLSPENYNLWSGKYITPPPPVIPVENTGAFNYGFNVLADPVTQVINGSLMYTCSNCNQWPPQMPLAIEFVSVRGEWMFEISHWTYAVVYIDSGSIGDYQIYDVTVESVAPLRGLRNGTLYC